MCKIIAENNALNYMPCYRLQNNFIAKINYGKSWNCLRRNFEWRHSLVAIFKTIVFGKTVCSYSKIMPSMLIKKKTEQNYNRIFMFYTHINIETSYYTQWQQQPLFLLLYMILNSYFIAEEVIIWNISSLCLMYSTFPNVSLSDL